MEQAGGQRIMAYSKKQKQEILTLVDAGYPIKDLAEEKKISRATIHNWLKKRNNPDNQETIENLKKQLSRLSGKKKYTEATSRKIAMLTKSLERLQRTERQVKARQKPKPKLEALFNKKQVKELREKALSEEYGLYQYQKDILSSQAQFRLVLKARQTGFSYVCALDALIAAMAGRNQLFLSASEEQAVILMRYVQFHAKRLGIVLSGGEKEYRVGDAVIKALAHNFRTVQGFTGDIWMDEFAWYPNPKKIWHAFVPSIGAIKGRLTILSTPFEEESLFHELCRNETRYFMFERFRVDIYKAIADGLDFDLETMRALFDADTWASAYECQFIDDEAALFSISLIKKCVDPDLSYFMPPSKSVIFSGYDIGRTKDASALAQLLPEKELYTLCNMEILRKASFDDQELLLKSFMDTYPLAQLKIDKTGIGMQLAERIKKQYGKRAQGAYFTTTLKEFLCLNLKKMFEDKAIRIPNRPDLIADIHSIKRKAGQKTFLYDSDRNSHGHADQFWALALAASHFKNIQKKKGKAWII
jgi:phage FluMu gp28-like protein/predicted DNA-binding protein YlxM (UPF0122 family)